MKEIVERLQEKRNIELAKNILESHGYRVVKNRLKESSIPVSDDCISLDSFSKEEDIEFNETLFSYAADALGTSINNILCCGEGIGDETYRFFKEQSKSATKVRDIQDESPGVHIGLYKLKDGTPYVKMVDFGYDSYYFIDPTKSINKSR